VRNRARMLGAGSAVVALAAAGVLTARPQLPGDRPAGGYYSDALITKSCGECHARPLDKPKLPDNPTELVLGTEYPVWQQFDLHRRAFDALGSERGVQISRLLYGDPAAAARKPECLACHATDTAPRTELASKKPEQFRCGLGVNCQTCHGPPEKWDVAHRDWRTRSGHEKQSDFGMVNLRDPAVRAATCAGCHVGSVEEGRFVTHDMYAAGHPPLPPFELATFSRDQPRHWLSPADVPHIRELESGLARERYSYRAGEVEAARLAAVGAVVCLRRSVALLGFEPDPTRPSPELDFAHFNCVACHHDLRADSDRQKHGFPGVPGRPVPQTWSVWLVRAVLRHAESADRDKAGPLRRDFEAGYDALRRTFDARPFGDKAEVLKAAAAFDATCSAVQELVEKTLFDEPAARGLLAALVAEAAAALDAGAARRRDYLDADGMLQIVRAVAAIQAELGGYDDPSPAVPTRPPTPDRLRPDPAGVAKLLAGIDAELPLAVRSTYRNGLDGSGNPLPDAETCLIQHEQLGLRLKTAAEFKSSGFRDRFAELTRRLGPGTK
jgi:hypothetical protein